ncbi:Homeobox-leucine zipper protein HOX14 [Hordeum vulgare]|nr:Homeobox-leucine zipper protein HOX14 [Hordeum vulgare]
MEPSSSSSHGSRSSETAAPLVPIKPEPQETPLRRRSRSGNLVINEGRHVPSPPRNHIRLVKPKKEPTTVVKQEHEDMTTDLESVLARSRANYVKQGMERQRRSLEKIAERRCGCDEGGVIVLSDSDEEVTAPSKRVHNGDPRRGCCKDTPKDGQLSNCDDDGGGDDYTIFYNLLGVNKA